MLPRKETVSEICDTMFLASSFYSLLSKCLVNILFDSFQPHSMSQSLISKKYTWTEALFILLAVQNLAQQLHSADAHKNP